MNSHREYKKLLISTIFILSLTMISLSGCVDPIDEPVLPERGFFMGLLPTPAENQDFSDVYLQAAAYAEFVPIWSSGTGASGFWDYADSLSGWWGNTFLKEYIRGNGMFPLIHFSFIDRKGEQLVLKTPETLADATLSTPEWRDLYKASVLDVVQSAHPKYISIGNEVNRWYELYGNSETDPNGFQHFVSLYEEIYDAIKAIAPETFVFCVFSREIVSENREADMSVLSMFDANKMDILALTTYPYVLPKISRASDIPLDYYSSVADFMPNKPFGFSEIGWSSLDFFGGEQGQYDFLINLSTILTVDQGINLHLFGYCWLHDLEGGDTTGLINRDGSEKQGYDAWKEISQST